MSSAAGQAGFGGAGAPGVSGGAGGPAGTGSSGASGSAGASADPNAPKPSAGCSNGVELADGTHELSVQNLERRFVLRKPTRYAAGGPWPLVLALHPNGSNTGYWDGTDGDRALRPLLADQALLLIAQARELEAGKSDWRGDLPADLAYFEAALAQIKSNLCVDEARIFSMGFSGGGSFSGVLGCHRPDIRAIAAGGAVIYFDQDDCIGTPAAWITIGDGEVVQGRLDYRDFFRSDAGCTDTSTPVAPAPCIAYQCPDPERPVQFCSHPGGHEWPSFGIDAAFRFFSQF